jgi:hypothetical protein
MKKLALLLFTLLVNFNLLSQFCSTTGLVNMGVITPTGTFQNVSNASSAKRYWRFTATAGCTYDFSTCNSAFTNDTYLRLYSTATGGTVLAQNDDNGPFCGGTKASLTWVCPANGTYSILVTNYSCANLSATTILSYRVTCAPVYNPCSSITTIASCGTNVSTTMSGGGAGWNVSTCGFSTPGQERIFQFTPTQTGTYTLNVTSITGGYVDFFWKPASGGCGSTGWNCIDDISFTGSFNGVTPMTFTAGVTYYILLDPETTGTYNVTFNLGCPIVAPANDLICNATTITCGSLVGGTTVGSTLTGAGEGGSCGTTQTTGGVWYKVVGTGDVMTASLCVTAWDSKMSVFQGSCTTPVCVGGIDDNGPSCTGTAASYSWTSTPGVTYFILVHGYSTTSTFSLAFTCSPPPPPGPCLNTTAWSVENLPTTTTPDVTTLCSAGNGQYTDEYSQWNNGVAGVTYTVLSSIPTDWVTVTVSTPNGTVVSYGSSPLDFTASINATYYVHINANGYCLDDANCRNVTVSRISALPIELISFDGVNNGSSNLLYWLTASEHNNNYFTLERSNDGENWEEVTKIVAAGQSTQELSYSYSDETFSRNMINYYRLSQTDYDGTTEFFNIVSLDNTLSNKKVVKYINITGQEIDVMSATGVYFKVYDDGSMKRVYKQ